MPPWTSQLSSNIEDSTQVKASLNDSNWVQNDNIDYDEDYKELSPGSNSSTNDDNKNNSSKY